MNIKNFILKIIFFLSISILLKSCGIYRPTSAKEFPPEPEKRVQKNIQEGRGIRLFSTDKKGGNFDFASSNEMWRASLDIIDFIPLISADYGGGLIITDWYSDQNNIDQSIKISIRFLSNEIRSDSLEITVFNKDCGSEKNCKIIKSNSKIESELKIAILKQAAQYKKNLVDSVKKRDLNSIISGDDRQ